MTNPFDLTGKVALVTGANTGIGQGIALALAAAGADLAVVGHIPPDETIAEAEAMGRRALYIEANLLSIEPVGRIVAETLSAFGRLDVLVNNAGIIRRADAVEFSEADWDAVMDINLKTAFFLSQAAGRHMLEQGSGKIINIASMLSFQGGIRVPSYTASKSGVAGITKLLANEWGARGVNVNAHRAGLYRHRQHRPAARRRGPQPRDSRSHSRRALGHACRPRRRCGVPRVERVRLRQRPHPRGRRGLAGAMKHIERRSLAREGMRKHARERARRR